MKRRAINVLGLSAILLSATAVLTAAPTGGWVADASKAAPPSAPAKGRVHGETFTVQQATLNGSDGTGKAGMKSDHGTYFLNLKQGKEFFADKEFMLFIAVNLGEKLDGKSYAVAPNVDSFKQPGVIKVKGVSYPPIQGVHMSWKAKGKSLPETEMPMGGYSLRLTFEKRQGDRLPGRIYLCMPDKAKSWVAGAFTAQVK